MALRGTVELGTSVWCNSDTLRVLSASRVQRSQSRKFLVFVVPRKDMESPLLKVNLEDRNFDIAVRFYEEPGLNQHFLEMADFVMTGGLSKFHAASQFLKCSVVKQDYEGYFFLDGDLEFDAARLSSFLEFSLAAGFDLAQPSVTKDSYCYWSMAYHQPDYIYRQTSFVEVMAPYLSRASLGKLLPTFTQSISTYGLDLVWPSLVNSDKIGVVDAFQVRHLEMVDHNSGNFYKYLKSIGVDLDEEERRILAEFGVTPDRAHSLRGYMLKKTRMQRDNQISLVSVPLYEIEKRCDQQWVIDLLMWLASLGPAREEITRSATLQSSVRELLNLR